MENVNQKFLNLSQVLNNMLKPGSVFQLPTTDDTNYVIGPGLRQIKTWDKPNCQKVILLTVNRIGVLRTICEGDNQTIWIELPSICSDSISGHTLLGKSHVSSFSVGDKIIGIVQKKTGEQFSVNIGCGSLAILHYLAFEGSSKKTKPDVKVGDVLYACVRSADIDMEVELQCVDENGKSKEFGVVGRLEPGVVGNSGSTQGGILLSCSRQTVMKLLDKLKFPLLDRLSETFSYEVYLGVNGAIWLNCKSPKDLQVIANAILLAQYVPSSQCLEYASSLV